MSAFRRIEAEQAGPSALGILIPPSRRTFLILRPRSLSFDFLLLRRHDDPAFRELSHDEATAAAHQLYRGLIEEASGGAATIELVTVPNGSGSWIRLRIGPLFMVACTRAPGEAYQPHFFADAAALKEAVAELTAVICPPAEGEQELYFNTRHFQA